MAKVITSPMARPSDVTVRELPGGQSRRKWETGMWIGLFLLPFLLLFGAFTLWPLAATIIYSFFDWNGIDPLSAKNYIGLGNYEELLRDPLFWQSFWNTLLFSVLNTLIKLPLSLVLAILLTRKWLWLKRFFRTVFFVPIILPVALAGQIFTFLLNPSNGALDSFLQATGLIKQPIDLLGNESTTLLTVVVISVWQIFGQYMLYWMAALQTSPRNSTRPRRSIVSVYGNSLSTLRCPQLPHGGCDWPAGAGQRPACLRDCGDNDWRRARHQQLCALLLYL